MSVLLRRLAQLPFTVTLTCLLAVAVLDYEVLPAGNQQRLVQWASTNVDRLVTQPFGPLLVSPFVVLDRPVVWIVVTAIGLATAESRLGWARTLLLVLGGHVLGTIVSQGIVGWRESRGALPPSVLHQVDVGISYVAVTALAAGAVAARPAWLRVLPVVVLAVLAPGLTDGLGRLETAAVGHVTAFLFGGIVAWVTVVRENKRLRIRRPRPIRRRL